ncbi:MAG: hypothetical protein AAB295_12185, partial [Chloroflexota bacterium]
MDATMASGKTTKGITTAVDAANHGERLLFVANSHDVVREVVALARQHTVVGESAAVIHLSGKRADTCIKANWESSQCSSCHCYRWGFAAGQPNDQAFQESNAQCQGRILDTGDLTAIAKSLGTCARVLGLLQAHAAGRVVIAPNAYLVSGAGGRIVDSIAPDRIIVDEGDAYLDSLQGHHQLELTIAGARERPDAPHTVCSATSCQRCHLDFATACGKGGIEVARRGGTQDALYRPQRLLALMR